MKIINEALLNETTGRAKQSPRLRMNYNFHEHLDDPVNRLLNAPGTGNLPPPTPPSEP